MFPIAPNYNQNMQPNPVPRQNVQNPMPRSKVQNNARPTEDRMFNFSEDAGKNAKAMKVKEYQEELNRQIREKQLMKQREKEEQNRMDEKIKNENLSYDPYGRSGGGAPIKDVSGNIVADLATIKPDLGQFSPRDLQKRNFQYPPPQMAAQAPAQYQPIPQPVANQSYDYNSQFSEGGGNTERKADQKFARGGNGIFGEGKVKKKFITFLNYCHQNIIQYLMSIERESKAYRRKIQVGTAETSCLI